MVVSFPSHSPPPPPRGGGDRHSPQQSTAPKAPKKTFSSKITLELQWEGSVWVLVHGPPRGRGGGGSLGPCKIRVDHFTQQKRRTFHTIAQGGGGRGPMPSLLFCPLGPPYDVLSGLCRTLWATGALRPSCRAGLPKRRCTFRMTGSGAAAAPVGGSPQATHPLSPTLGTPPAALRPPEARTHCPGPSTDLTQRVRVQC